MQLHHMQTPSTQPLPRIATRYPEPTSPSQSRTIHIYRARETNNPDVCIKDGRGLWCIGPNKTVVESDTRKVKRPFASVKLLFNKNTKTLYCGQALAQGSDWLPVLQQMNYALFWSDEWMNEWKAVPTVQHVYSQFGFILWETHKPGLSFSASDTHELKDRYS